MDFLRVCQISNFYFLISTFRERLQKFIRVTVSPREELGMLCVEMTAKIYSRPVIPLLASMISGIASGSWFPGYRVWSYSVIFVCAALILYLIKQKKTVFISPIILFIALGYLSIQPWVSPRFPSNHVINFADTHKWKIVGVIDKSPVRYKNRLRFILQAETLVEDNRSFSVTGKIRVTVTGNMPNLSVGDRISFAGRIKSIRNFNNPGGFDYRRYMAFKKIWTTSYVRGERLVILKKNREKGVCRIIEDSRNKISDLIEKTGQGEEQGVLKALIIGDRNSIPQYLREAFNRAGAGHLLAISGLHIGIVATVTFIFFRWILSYFKPFLWNAWTKKGAAALSLFPVFAYGLLSGMSPSTQRAVIMVTVFLMTFLLERESDPINTLALAAMLILAAYPPSLFAISFQLSFSAVFSIIYGLSWAHNNIWPHDNGMIKKGWLYQVLEKLLSFLLVSFFAILGTMPIVMLYFNQVSLVGLAANFLLVPIIGFIVVPLGLFSVFLYPLSICGASWCINASAAVLAQSLNIVNFFAQLPFAAVKTITPTYFEICCFYILVWAVLNLKSIQPKEQRAEHTGYSAESGAQWAVFRRKTAIIVLTAVILAGSIDCCYWLYNRFWHDDFRATIIDVGQGSCALLELPGGPCFLVDGGGFSDNSVFDVGARIVAPFLWRKKIKTVDTIVLSHPNSDHLNGLLYIARHFNVKDIWTNNETVETIGYRKLMEIIEKDKIHMPTFKDMSRIHDINGVRLKILYPPDDFIDKREKEKWRDLNNNSLVLKAEFGSKSFLFPGDIMACAERELVAIAGDELKSTVLIAPHHGSRTSSTGPFLDKVEPELVIISSGWNNRFRFPHPSVLKRYRELGCGILRTDSHGAVTISTDGEFLSLKPTVIQSS